MATGVYGTDLSRPWVALCCTPVVGGVISFVGAAKWGNEAARLPQLAADQEQLWKAKRAQQQQGHGRQESEDFQGFPEGYLGEVARKQAVYVSTGLVSSVLSLALMVQNVVLPIFLVWATWTAAYAVGSYYAIKQVATVAQAADEPVFPKPISLAVPCFRWVYALV